MKRFTKFFVSLLAVIILAGTCLGLTACAKDDIRRVELTVQVNNEEKVITLDLYRNLAPTTVDKMLEYIKDGYYDDALFYSPYSGVDSGVNLKSVMMGDLKMIDGEIVQNDIKPMLEKGEFEKGGAMGTNLKVSEHSLVLWRNWSASNGSYTSSSKLDIESGRATWMMPTQSITSYDKYFCVFGVMNTALTDTDKVWDEIRAQVLPDATTTKYVVYYTGEYDQTKPNENFGLTFHCEKQSELGDVTKIDGLFEAKGEQFTCFNSYVISVPNQTCKVVSAKVL